MSVNRKIPFTSKKQKYSFFSGFPRFLISYEAYEEEGKIDFYIKIEIFGICNCLRNILNRDKNILFYIKKGSFVRHFRDLCFLRSK